MAYQRKTRDYWDIEGDYGYGDGWEVVTAEDSWSEALARLREYRANEPGVPFRARKRREPITAAQHDFQRARFTGAVSCARCGLMPLDADDYELPCE